jgi:hypothetical protein
MFGVISRNFVAARHTFRKRVLGCIQSTSFCHRNQFFVFRNEHAQSSTLGSKLMFGVVSRYILAARHPFRKRVSHTKHEFLPPEPILRFSQRTCPIHYIRSKTHVLGWFHAISLPHVTHSENMCRGAYKARVFATETNSSFFATNMPNPLLYVKTHVWGGFAQFRCRTSHIPKTGVGVHTKHEFMPPNHFFVFRNEHAQSTT